MLRSHRSPAYLILAASVVCAGLLTTGLTSPALAGDRPTKLERQIAVAVRTIDEMLVDSANFLVSNHEPTEGYEIEDLGALFVFHASLTGPEWDIVRHSGSWFWPWKKHDRIVMIDHGDKKKEIFMDGNRLVIKDGTVYASDGDKLRKLDGDEWDEVDEKSYLEGQLKKYDRAKQELVDALLDCGDILGALPAGRAVRIEARLEDVELPNDREVRKLSVRAKVDDLRSYSDGHLSESDMRARVEIKES